RMTRSFGDLVQFAGHCSLSIVALSSSSFDHGILRNHDDAAFSDVKVLAVFIQVDADLESGGDVDPLFDDRTLDDGTASHVHVGKEDAVRDLGMAVDGAAGRQHGADRASA